MAALDTIEELYQAFQRFARCDHISATWFEIEDTVRPIGKINLQRVPSSCCPRFRMRCGSGIDSRGELSPKTLRRTDADGDSDGDASDTYAEEHGA